MNSNRPKAKNNFPHDDMGYREIFFIGSLALAGLSAEKNCDLAAAFFLLLALSSHLLKSAGVSCNPAAFFFEDKIEPMDSDRQLNDSPMSRNKP